MNILLDDALAAGPDSSEFYLLLKNYGMWSRYFGCSGYANPGVESATPVIDDDTAMLVEKAVIVLKRSRPNVWRVFRLHYVYDFTPERIAAKIRRENREQNRAPRRPRRKNYFEYNPALDSALRHINSSCVCDLIKIAEKLIFSSLVSIK